MTMRRALLAHLPVKSLKMPRTHVVIFTLVWAVLMVRLVTLWPRHKSLIARLGIRVKYPNLFKLGIKTIFTGCWLRLIWKMHKWLRWQLKT